MKMTLRKTPLDEREEQVLRLHSEEGLSCVKIGWLLGVTRERARQIIRDARARQREQERNPEGFALLPTRVRKVLRKLGYRNRTEVLAAVRSGMLWCEPRWRDPLLWDRKKKLSKRPGTNLIKVRNFGFKSWGIVCEWLGLPVPDPNGEITPPALWGDGRPVEKMERQLGLVGWDDELWALRLEELRGYREKYGHVRVPANWRGNVQLGRWLAYQRQQARRGLIEPDRWKRLEELGVECAIIREPHVEEHELYMKKMLARLEAYRKEHGHMDVRDEEDHALAYWIGRQRIYRNAGILRNYRREMLDAAGFPWKPGDRRWEEKFARLVKFKEKYGHTRVPRHWKGDGALGRWVEHQRARYRKGEMSADHKRRLKKLGFAWEIEEPTVEAHDQHMERMLERLKEYRAMYGHGTVLRSRDRALAEWLQQQRSYRSAGVMRKSRRQKMDEAGVPLKPEDGRWDEQFARLLAFKERFGHARVPAEYEEDQKLGSWTVWQRQHHRTGKLSAEHRRRLEEIGFAWGAGPRAEERDRRTEEMLARLAAYRERHGQVPVTGARDASLTRWICLQRELRKAGKLTEDYCRRLDAAGFQWDPLGEIWNEMFARLVAFKARFGHTQVYQKWAEDQTLGKWVSRQRGHHRAGRLPEEHRRRLEEIGFVWEVPTGVRRVVKR